MTYGSSRGKSKVKGGLSLIEKWEEFLETSLDDEIFDEGLDDYYED